MVGIFVKRPRSSNGGRGYIQVDVEPTDTIEAVCRKIEAQEGIPWDTQRLIASGRQLQYGKQVSDYRIRDGATLHMALRLGRGARKMSEVSVRTAAGELHAVSIDLRGPPAPGRQFWLPERRQPPTVGDLKRLVSEKLGGVPPQLLHLRVGGFGDLGDDRLPLQRCGITDGSTVDVQVTRMTKKAVKATGTAGAVLFRGALEAAEKADNSPSSRQSGQ